MGIPVVGVFAVGISSVGIYSWHPASWRLRTDIFPKLILTGERRARDMHMTCPWHWWSTPILRPLRKRFISPLRKFWRRLASSIHQWTNIYEHMTYRCAHAPKMRQWSRSIMKTRIMVSMKFWLILQIYWITWPSVLEWERFRFSGTVANIGKFFHGNWNKKRVILYLRS